MSLAMQYTANYTANFKSRLDLPLIHFSSVFPK